MLYMVSVSVFLSTYFLTGLFTMCTQEALQWHIMRTYVYANIIDMIL